MDSIVKFLEVKPITSFLMFLYGDISHVLETLDYAQ
jgi:hypothetical protein